MSENNFEMKKVKFEIEIPVVYYEALLNNPDAIDPDEIMEKIKKSATETLAKTYNNPRTIPPVMKKYLESKYGKPVTGAKKAVKAAEETETEPTETEPTEPVQEETTPVADNNNSSSYRGW